jgi:hypothetical protein
LALHSGQFCRFLIDLSFGITNVCAYGIGLPHERAPQSPGFLICPQLSAEFLDAAMKRGDFRVFGSFSNFEIIHFARDEIEVLDNRI